MWKCLISQLLESSWVWPTMPQCCQQANAPSRLLRSAAFMKHEGLGPNTQRWMSSLGFANRALSVFTSNPFWPKFLTARQDPPLTLKNDGEPGGTSEEISFSMRRLIQELCFQALPSPITTQTANGPAARYFMQTFNNMLDFLICLNIENVIVIEYWTMLLTIPQISFRFYGAIKQTLNFRVEVGQQNSSSGF